jgi:hypothetical protein
MGLVKRLRTRNEKGRPKGVRNSTPLDITNIIRLSQQHRDLFESLVFDLVAEKGRQIAVLDYIVKEAMTSWRISTGQGTDPLNLLPHSSPGKVRFLREARAAMREIRENDHPNFVQAF